MHVQLHRYHARTTVLTLARAPILVHVIQDIPLMSIRRIARLLTCVRRTTAVAARYAPRPGQPYALVLATLAGHGTATLRRAY